MKQMCSSLVIALIAVLISSSSALAEENLWLYATGTDTRPKGSSEFKLSSISRIGRNSGSYEFHDIRPANEYGVTDRLTIGAELFIFDHKYSVGEDGPEPMVETQAEHGGTFNKTQIGGYELASKYNILSPYKDAFGLSVGLAYEHRNRYRLDGARIDQHSIVPMIFLQKNFLDDTLAFALTTKIEFERRRSPDTLEREIALDAALGVSYRIAPKWFVGLEFRHQSDYLCPRVNGECEDEEDVGLKETNFDPFDFKVGSQHQYGNYFGPTVHYAEKDWWLTTGILFQVSGGGSRYADVRNNKNWDEHESYHLGLSIGYEF